MVASRNPRRIAIEITAAGIDVEKVRPALRPKYTLAAVNTNVIRMPRIRPRRVSSLRVCSWPFTRCAGYVELAKAVNRVLQSDRCAQDADRNGLSASGEHFLVNALR